MPHMVTPSDALNGGSLDAASKKIYGVCTVVPAEAGMQSGASAWDDSQDVVGATSVSKRRLGSGALLRIADWDDDDASIDALIYNPSGLRTFLSTAPARLLFASFTPLSLGIIVLTATRPMGASGWPVLGRDLGAHHVAVIEIYVVCFLWCSITYVLLIRSSYSMAMNLLLPWTACCLINMLAGIPLSITAQDPCHAIYFLVFAPVFVYLFWLALTQGLFMLRVLQLAPLCFITFATGCFYYGDILWACMWLVTLIPGACISFYIQVSHHLTIRAAVRLVRSDAEQYNAIWARFNEAERAGIDSIESEACAIQKRQVARESALRQDAMDLNELFEQAECLEKPLRSKLTAWALRTGGRAVDAPLKQQGRALQKTMRSYIGDASRITDLVRGAIAFGTLGELLQCLRAIANDDQVCIRKIKNRFARSYDSSKSAGYRDICLVLQLRTPETRASGTDRHLCELQLHIEDMLAVKTDEGHRRYVQWRNMRCE